MGTRFDDFLDEINEPVTLNGVQYAFSEVLKAVDPIAYDLAETDWEDDEDE
jgi:hypothetical protein